VVSDEQYINDLKERLWQSMKKKAVSKAVIAKEIGITLVTLANFLNTKRATSHIVAAKIENWLDK